MILPHSLSDFLVGLIFLSEHTIMIVCKETLAAQIKFFQYVMSQSSLAFYWMNLVFSLLIIFNIALLSDYTSQTMIATSLTLMNFKPCWALVFFLLAAIGKIGAFPFNLGNICIVDGLSLFSSYQALVLNKV